MAYSSQSDLEAVFGVANIQTWSQLDPDLTAADTARITLAIANADAQINNAFRDGKFYTVPLGTGSGGYDPVLVNWSATLAGAWLLRARPARDSDTADWVADLVLVVEKEIALYKSGARVLDAGFAASKHVTSPIPVTSAEETVQRPVWGQDRWCGVWGNW